MHDMLVGLAGLAYSAIAFRMTYVTMRARRNSGFSEDRFLSVIFGLLWFITLPAIGFIIGLSGDAGIFRTPLPSQGCQKE